MTSPARLGALCHSNSSPQVGPFLPPRPDCRRAHSTKDGSPHQAHLRSPGSTRLRPENQFDWTRLGPPPQGEELLVPTETVQITPPPHPSARPTQGTCGSRVESPPGTGIVQNFGQSLQSGNPFLEAVMRAASTASSLADPSTSVGPTRYTSEAGGRSQQNQ